LKVIKENIMTCKCGKNKDCKCGTLTYITNPQCGWCKKADPVVAKLIEEGHKITTLDMSNPEEAAKANKIKEKHKAQCGTPLFIDAKSGNMVCGFNEPNIGKWVNGEAIPAPPPRPAPQPQQAPSNVEAKKFNLSVWQEAEQNLRYRYDAEFQVWSDGMLNVKTKGNSLIEERPKYPTSEQIFAESIKLLQFCSR
jgi:hypothetical protein|tara:strand:+ start:433 stop:1017 length:585 start_codon:yes stop_codon:yes gene_type:complete